VLGNDPKKCNDRSDTDTQCIYSEKNRIKRYKALQNETNLVDETIRGGRVKESGGRVTREWRKKGAKGVKRRRWRVREELEDKKRK